MTAIIFRGATEKNLLAVAAVVRRQTRSIHALASVSTGKFSFAADLIFGKTFDIIELRTGQREVSISELFLCALLHDWRIFRWPGQAGADFGATDV